MRSTLWFFHSPRFQYALLTLFLILTPEFLQASRSAPIIVDHHCTDLAQIPALWIERVKQNLRLFHASTSHGMQPIEGMSRLETYDPRYGMAYDWSLPVEANSLCILHQSWYEPELFFTGVQGYLDANPLINVAMYFWCGQASDYDVNQYISAIEALEAANPKVTFVYTTGHAQENDCAGCGRHRFNEALRKYCREHNKVLFDFADMDVWYNDEMHTYISPSWCACAGEAIPLQHPHYNGDEAYHTTFESCELKGKAFWWMLAKIAGWESATPVEMGQVRASFDGQTVAIHWSGRGESNLLGYNVLRSRRASGPFSQINDRLITREDNLNKANEYLYKDRQPLAARIYFYKVQRIALDGSSTLSEPVSVQVGSHLPGGLRLNQNYPNPFNATTAISFYLPTSQSIVLEIYNLTGEKVTTLLDARQAPGWHSVSWNGRNAEGLAVPSGVYLCRLSADGFDTALNITLLR